MRAWLTGSVIGVSVRNTIWALSPAWAGMRAASRSRAFWAWDAPPLSLSW